MLDRAECDTVMQQDLMDACAESILFFINAFCMTWHQFDVVKGKRVEAEYPHQPFITWEIQDELFMEFLRCVREGEDILIDKARDMGASWCGIDFLHWNMLFVPDTDILEVSRNEDYVDKAGNMKALFQRHDYINKWLPDWMVPPGCFPGEEYRTHMHWHNPLINTTMDGESTTKAVGVGDRRKLAFFDEFGLVQNGTSVRNKSRDMGLVRIINSTSQPGSEYNKWRSDNTIKVFVMPFWEHPQKGEGRYVKQLSTGGYEIRSPWCDIEEGIRGRQFMATEVYREDIEPGSSFFRREKVDAHRAMYARAASATLDVRFKMSLGNKAIKKLIKTRDLKALSVTETALGDLKLWCNLINGRPDQTKTYIFGIDVSKGQGASNTVFSIKCRETGEKVGEWANAQYPPYEAAPICVAIAIWFGGAAPRRLPFLKWENNGPGWDFGRLIVLKYGYPFYYRTKTVGKVVEKQTESYGWHNGTASKFILLSSYAASLITGRFINRSSIALDETIKYVHLKGGGIGPATLEYESAQAKKTHGDRTMADALANDEDEALIKDPDKKSPPKNSAGYRFMQHIKKRKNKNRIRVRVSRRKRSFNFAMR